MDGWNANVKRSRSFIDRNPDRHAELVTQQVGLDYVFFFKKK